MATRKWRWLGCSCALFMVACGSGSAPDVQVGEASAVETAAEALAKNALSAAQAKTTLRLIDNICGDTWCDGDYDFGFRRLTCAKAAGTCTLTLQVFPREGVPSEQHSYWRSCKTHGFKSFESLVSTAPSGYQSLTGEYYDALTECTLRVVSNLH